MGVSDIRVHFNVDLNAAEQNCTLTFTVNDNDGIFPFSITLTSQIKITAFSEDEKKKLTTEQEFSIRMEQALETFPLEFEAFQGNLTANSEIRPPNTVISKIDMAGEAQIYFDSEIRMAKYIEKLNSTNEGSVFFLIQYETNEVNLNVTVDETSK